jgi:membrane protein implicated in regulation of membrane protease activity
LALAIIIIVALIIVAVMLTVRAHERKVAAGREDMVGRTAVVKTSLSPKGMVFVEDELWNAEIDSGIAEPEEEVTIARVEGLKLYVTRK